MNDVCLKTFVAEQQSLSTTFFYTTQALKNILSMCGMPCSFG